MDFQVIINVLLGLVAFFGGIVVKGIYDSISLLQRQDADLATKVQSIEVLVAGTYVKRDEFERLAEAIFRKLDKISDILEKKADKHDLRHPYQ